LTSDSAERKKETEERKRNERRGERKGKENENYVNWV
jgi:hypothetical protein